MQIVDVQLVAVACGEALGADVATAGPGCRAWLSGQPGQAWASLLLLMALLLQVGEPHRVQRASTPRVRHFRKTS